MDDTHGSPFDRGSADSYYGRPMNPHYWPDGTHIGDRVSKDEMTAKQIEEYYTGYDWNEQMGFKKEW